MLLDEILNRGHQGTDREIHDRRSERDPGQNGFEVEVSANGRCNGLSVLIDGNRFAHDRRGELPSRLGQKVDLLTELILECRVLLDGFDALAFRGR